MTATPAARGLRVVALLEGGKGVLVLLAGFELLSLIHRDLHAIAAELVRHLHLNPAGRYPCIFLDLAGRLDSRELWFLAAAALFYAALRLVEAYGLWRQRRWAEWFGVVSSGVYLPVELYEALVAPSWAKLVILGVNLGVVGLLARALAQSRHESG